MLKSYEAIYDHGQVRWLDTPPDVDGARLIVTLLPWDDPAIGHQRAAALTAESAKPVDALLAETAGAWGRLSLAEVDARIQSLRQRDWGED